MSATAKSAPIVLLRQAPDARHAFGAEPPVLHGAGSEVYAQGDRADRLFRVEFGAVRIHRLLADGRRQICAFYLPGEVFGFEADGVHHFFAEAVSATGLTALRGGAGAEAAYDHLGAALRSLVRAQEHLLVVGRQNAAERIAAFLLDMAERQGGLEQFDLPMSRSDIGDYLGLTIETVSRVFSKLRAQGIIRLLGLRSVEVKKSGVLRAMCE